MAKDVMVGGVKYTVPDSFDPAILQNQLEIEERLDESIDETIHKAGLVPSSLEAAHGASQLDLRRDAARTLQEARGLTRSGRGLGIARDISHSTDMKSGVLRTRNAKEVAEARQEAAATKTQGLVEKGKLLEAKAARKAAGSKARLRAEEIKKKYAGDIYTTRSDRKQMIKELKAERDAAISPEAAQIYQDEIDTLNTGKTEGTGGMDMPL